MTLTLQEDMENVFLESGFEEDIVYTPDGESAKTISAFVFRNGSVESMGHRGVRTDAGDRRYNTEILISTDATAGVANPKINVDTVALSASIGATPYTWTVAGIIQSDAGAHSLGLK